MDQKPLIPIGKREKKNPQRHQPLQHARLPRSIVQLEAEHARKVPRSSAAHMRIDVRPPIRREDRVRVDKEEPILGRCFCAGVQLPPAPPRGVQNLCAARAGKGRRCIVRTAIGHDNLLGAPDGSKCRRQTRFGVQSRDDDRNTRCARM